MANDFSIKVSKEYFNFSSSHFLLFKDGTREPLHGHNYRVKVQGHSKELSDDMVFNFLDIKPIVKEVCDSLDHRLLIPQDNPHLEIHQKNNNYNLKTSDGSFFSIPVKDILFLPISNISAERLAIYLANKIRDLVTFKFNFTFDSLTVEVEETSGQSAEFTLDKDKN